MGLAKSIGTNLQGKTIIAFQDFNALNNSNTVSSVKGDFADKDFTDGLTVTSFIPDLRA